MNYTLQRWQWAALMRYARSADNYGEYVRFILHLAAVPPLLQLERHAYPGQPSTRAEHVVQRCRCDYLALCCGEYLGGMLWMCGPGRWCDVTQSWHHIATGFVTHPACPHHGHLAHTHLIERMWESPYEYGVLRDPYDLDDDERR